MSFDRNTIPKTKVKFNVIRDTNWDFIGLLAIWFVALLITGLNEFVRAGFDPSVLFTGTWWYNIFRTLMTNMIVFFGTWYYFLKVALENDEIILKEESEVNDIVRQHLDPITFDLFLPHFNRDRKKFAYKNHLVELHNKVDSKISKKPDVLDLWAKHLKNPDQQFWKEHKLTKRKFFLLEQMREEYIEENIDSIDVSFKPLTKKFVTNGYTHTKPGRDDYHVEDASTKLVKDLFPRFAFTLTLLIGINSVLIEALQQENRAVAFLIFLLNVLPLFLQIVFATNYVDKFIKEKTLVDFRTRKDVMINYLAYLKRQKEVTHG